MIVPWQVQLLGGLRAQRQEQSLTRFRTHQTGALLAYLAFYRQRPHPREALVEESLALCRELGNQNGIAANLNNLGSIAYRQGDYARARACCQEALRLRQKIGKKQDIADSLEQFARLAAIEGAPERVARLFGAAAALREALGAPVPANEQAEAQALIDSARNALGQALFTARYDAARLLSTDQAVAYALEEVRGGGL